MIVICNFNINILLFLHAFLFSYGKKLTKRIISYYIMSFVYKSFIGLQLWMLLVLRLDLVHAQCEELRCPQVPICGPVSPVGTQGKLTG